MSRPRREEFILDVRRSARAMQLPNVEADSDALDTDAIANLLHRSAQWLTQKVVSYYDPADFTRSTPEQQSRLQLAVAEFCKVAGQVPAHHLPEINQFMEGTERLRDLIGVLGNLVRDEWLNTITELEKLAEDWVAVANWRCRRVDKKITESLLGTYTAPQLLIFAEPSLYVLNPVARFIPGGQGAFDLAIQPSYHTTSLYRGDDELWYVHLATRNGLSGEQRVKWDRESFYKCFEELGTYA